MEHKSLDDLDFLLRESVNTIKGSIDQIYLGILEYLEEDERQVFLDHLKSQSDSLQDVLYKSIVERANQINMLNRQLMESNEALIALKNTLEMKVIDRTREITQIQEVTIFSLARLAESRDQETGEHLDRIRDYAHLLAEYLYTHGIYTGEITPKFIYNIYHTSPLHDIGKVGVRDYVLLKPGKLTPDEYEEMKKHTIIGGQTLEDAEKHLTSSDSAFLVMGKEIAFYHHEKWDGSGYPYGLEGENIPLCARIVALADVYDALTSKRVYKPAYTHEEARDIILNGRMTHFDPLITDAFLALEETFKKIKAGERLISHPAEQ